jgi:transcriptional regulator with XRE-family HTH domain
MKTHPERRQVLGSSRAATKGERKMADKNEVVRFLVETYFDGDAGRAASEGGFSKQQVMWWLNDEKKPQKSVLRRLMHAAVATEFRVLIEYQAIDYPTDKRGLRVRLRELLENREKASGLYAFYDSMASLVYLGKSNGNLFEEVYQQLNAVIKESIFPKGAKQPEKRRDVVRYLSAYEVLGSDVSDNAKHVESLILRISKPRLNKNIGNLKETED